MSWDPSSDGAFGRFDLAALLRLPHMQRFVCFLKVPGSVGVECAYVWWTETGQLCSYMNDKWRDETGT